MEYLLYLSCFGVCSTLQTSHLHLIPTLKPHHYSAVDNLWTAKLQQLWDAPAWNFIHQTGRVVTRQRLTSWLTLGHKQWLFFMMLSPWYYCRRLIRGTSKLIPNTKSALKNECKRGLSLEHCRIKAETFRHDCILLHKKTYEHVNQIKTYLEGVFKQISG